MFYQKRVLSNESVRKNIEEDIVICRSRVRFYRRNCTFLTENNLARVFQVL